MKNKNKNFQAPAEVFEKNSWLGEAARKWGVVIIYLSLILPLFFRWASSASAFLMPKNCLFLILTTLLSLCLVIYFFEKKTFDITKQQKYFLMILGGWLLVKLISLAFSPEKSLSFWGGLTRFEGVILYLALGIFVFAIFQFFQTEKQWRWLIVTLTVAATMLAGYALMQKAGILLLGETWSDIGVTRVVSTFGNPLYLSAFLISAIFLTIFCLSRKAFRKVRYELIACLIIQVLALFFTESSSAFLALAVSGVVCLIIYFWSKKRAFSIVILILGVVFAVVVGLAMADKVSIAKQIKPLEDLSFSKASNLQRLYAWESAWQAFGDKPFWGWGQERFVEAFNARKSPRLVDLLGANFDRAHNFILDQLVMEGVFGALLFLTILGWTIYYSLKKFRQTRQVNYLLSFGMVLGFFISSLFSIPVLANLSLLFLAFGMVFSNNREAEVEIVKTFQRKWLPIYGVSILGAAILIYVIILPLRAACLSRRATVQKVDEKIFAQYDKSLALWAFKETAVNRLEFVNFRFENKYKNTPAPADFERSAINSSNQWRAKYQKYYLIHKESGATWSYLKDEARVEEAFTQALVLAPTSYASYWSWGDAYRRLEKPDLAVAKYQAAIDLDPAQAYPYLKMSDLYSELNDKEKALEYKRLYEEHRP